VPFCMGCNDPVHFLRPTPQANADDNSYSGNYGLGDRYSNKSYSDPAEYYAIEPDGSMYEEDNNEPW
jgi:hypothetical protein